MRTGRRIALDIGKARIGVAVSDPFGILASPRDHLLRGETEALVEAVRTLVATEEAIEIYVGLPINLRNAHTESTADAISMAVEISKALSIPVRLIDERLTTKLASTSMSNAGKNTREQRGGIDSASAAIILETALQFEKVNSAVPGRPVSEFDDE